MTLLPAYATPLVRAPAWRSDGAKPLRPQLLPAAHRTPAPQ